MEKQDFKSPKEFLENKGYNIHSIQHPVVSDLIDSEINLFDLMEEYGKIIQEECNKKNSSTMEKETKKSWQEGYDEGHQDGYDEGLFDCEC